MICPKNNFIFIHIPKTAGRSVRSSLRPHCYTKLQELKRVIDLITVPLGMKPSQFPKSRYSSLSGHPLGLDYINQLGGAFYKYYRFTFVRNPYQRMISYYNWRIRNKAISETIQFSEFVRMIVAKNELIPQYDFITDRAGGSLVDYVGKVESIEEDFKVITKNIGIEAPLPHKNTAPRHQKTYFDAGTKSIVDEYYKNDLETFGYEYNGQ
jgi:hypothetical protein